jgi:hypothetical protein
MSEQESEKSLRREEDEPESDVEGHMKRRSEGAEPPAEEAGMRREGDEPDVEGHMKR